MKRNVLFGNNRYFCGMKSSNQIIIGRSMKAEVLLLFVFLVVCAIGCKKDSSSSNDSEAQAKTYIVTFNANGGSGDMQSQTFTEGKQQALMSNAFTREYYFFVSWNTVADGSGTSYRDLQKIVVFENMTLYAQWERTTYTVQFVSNGGAGDMQSQIFNAGEMQALSANTFTWENHVFIGWNTEWDGSGTAYSDTQEITLEENIVLWAQWIEATGQHGGHYYIDLGLPSGTKWALTNIGSDTPEGYGDYFAWGETDTKPDVFNHAYTTDNYTYHGNPATLPASVDAATANWGAGWRMPTIDELEELRTYTTHGVVIQNGRRVERLRGPNGCTIVLPAAGDLCEFGLCDEGWKGYYWSSSLDVYWHDGAKAYTFHHNGVSYSFQTLSQGRYQGFSVRPVFSD